jgi:transketolase
MTLNHAILTDIAHTIRGLSIDAIDAANSGHPGLPLGCAELFAYLYGYELNHNPDDPHWLSRDRFILSAGHGSMGLYAALHLAGFDVSLNDLKNFRQLHSKTAGHPEYGELAGVETTTGPLGQGIASAVGMALGMKMANRRFSAENSLIDPTVFVLAGDGCLMEGVSSEASSLAGHLKLDNLVLLFDSNDICLDGPTDECVSEDTAARYEAYGWFVQTIDGHSFSDIHSAVTLAKASDKPSIIIAKTTIGWGSPTYAGTSDVHGKPLGRDESKKVKQQLELPESPDFFVSDAVRDYFKARQAHQKESYTLWHRAFDDWRRVHPELARSFDLHNDPLDHRVLYDQLSVLALSPNKATRSQSAQCLQQLAKIVPPLVGGSADLSCSDNTFLSEYDAISADNYMGRNIKYGVREFAMASMATGLYLTGMFRPYVGTFLMFSDYMRNAIRLSALMAVPVVYQFTHDSVFLGEDGPTHQPVEHLASLRAMPQLTVCRPADENEVKAAWYQAMVSTHPTAIVLSRQAIQSLEQTSFDGAVKGGYVLHEVDAADVTIFATGSECALALQVAQSLYEQDTIKARVVSLMSWEVFQTQDVAYQTSVVGTAALNVSIEAGRSFGWERYVGLNGVSISIDTFGLSGTYADLTKHFGFDEASIVSKIKVAMGLVSSSR